MAAQDLLPTRFWMMKSEPETFSFQDLLKKEAEPWEGVRNHLARNFMRDHMQVGDWILFYHSNATPPGVAGLARVVAAATPDLTALDPKSPYFDPKATHEKNPWCHVHVGGALPLPRFIPLSELRDTPQTSGMQVCLKGQRLSVLPVSPDEFRGVLALVGLKPHTLGL